MTRRGWTIKRSRDLRSPNLPILGTTVSEKSAPFSAAK
jgi:hypothetical protein